MSPASQSRAMPSSIRTPKEPTTPVFAIDGASDDSALDSSPPLSPDDAELLAKLEEEAMMEIPRDQQNELVPSFSSSSTTRPPTIMPTIRSTRAQRSLALSPVLVL